MMTGGRMNEPVPDQIELHLNESCTSCRKEGFFFPFGECYDLPRGGWSRLLSIARIYGWQPAGTVFPEDYYDEPLWKGDPLYWDGRYWPGYGQFVTGEDAL